MYLYIHLQIYLYMYTHILGLTHELLQDLGHARAARPPEALRQSLQELRACVRAAAHILAAMPSIMLQQALNMPSSSVVHRAAATA